MAVRNFLALSVACGSRAWLAFDRASLHGLTALALRYTIHGPLALEAA